jgi:hypothetical protein
MAAGVLIADFCRLFPVSRPFEYANSPFQLQS